MRWRRVSGAALSRRLLTATRRRLTDSGVLLGPRRGRWCSIASRYRRTTRPSSRPRASAALWAAVIGARFLGLEAATARIMGLPLTPCNRDARRERAESLRTMRAASGVSGDAEDGVDRVLGGARRHRYGEIRWTPTHAAMTPLSSRSTARSG